MPWLLIRRIWLWTWFAAAAVYAADYGIRLTTGVRHSAVSDFFSPLVIVGTICIAVYAIGRLLGKAPAPDAG